MNNNYNYRINLYMVNVVQANELTTYAFSWSLHCNGLTRRYLCQTPFISGPYIYCISIRCTASQRYCTLRHASLTSCACFVALVNSPCSGAALIRLKGSLLLAIASLLFTLTTHWLELICSYAAIETGTAICS